MENRIYGIITIGIAVLLYAFAFKNYKKENYSNCLYFILIGGFLLRIYTSMDFYLHEWDERFHALVAKNLISNPLKPMLYSVPLLEYDYKNWAGNHIWVHKQPVPLYSIAISMLIFGKNTIALRIPSINLSTISILATFKIGKILTSSKVGILAAFLFSINGLIIESTAGRVATDHIDVFFYSLVTISVYLLLRSVKNNSTKSLILGAICTGIAILSKWLPALIVVPVWILFAYQKQSIKRIFGNIILLL
jgi:4-amino-4-deoxy-L-arabinose transferase